MSKVLVVAPGRKTRGGITAVIKAYEPTIIWKKYGCVWIETYIDRNAFFKILFFARSFTKFIAILPFYKIVHIHFSWTISAYRKLFFFIYAKLLGKKVIIHLHSGAEPIIASKAHKVYQFMFKHADVTVLLANAIKQKIEKHFEIKKSVIIFNPCLAITDHENEVKKEATILFAGTITEKKGTNDLIRAFSKVATEFPDWTLVLAGNGDIVKSESLADKLQIRNQIRFTGWISGNAKDELFSKASVFCLPSYTEGFPMAVLDAWAYGIPVVTTPVGGLPDILLHGENSMVFQPGDVDGLAQNLEILLSNKKLREKIGKESLEISKKLFHIGTISNQIDELYRTII
jgi:glycosyltransferase involved in cell wall biosynthesis